jgi:hypothetical protein
MGRKKALIIAVSEYDIDYPLKFCEKDGVEISKLLTSAKLAYEIEHKNKLIGHVKSQNMKVVIVDFFNDAESDVVILLFREEPCIYLLPKLIQNCP